MATAAVGFVFATWASSDGSNAFPSYERVAEGLGTSPRTVSRAVHRLVGEGWLVVVRERRPPYQMTTGYRLSIPSQWRVNATTETDEESPESGQPDSDDTATGQHCPVTRSIDTRTVTTTGDTNTTDQEVLALAKDTPSVWAGLDSEPPAASSNGDDESPSFDREAIYGPGGELPPSFWDDDEVEPPAAASNLNGEDEGEPFAATSAPESLGYWAAKEQRREQRLSDRDARELRDAYVPSWSNR
jgi:hypothetical protein